MDTLNEQKKIKICHETNVDKCIYKEILELNNRHNILTLFSCCGHRSENKAFIVVQDDDIEKMLSLDYKITDTYGALGKYVDNDDEVYIDIKNKDLIKECGRWFLAFRPKSKCICKELGVLNKDDYINMTQIPNIFAI